MSVLSELLKVKSWRIWLKGLLAGFISGFGSGLASAVAVPGASLSSIILASFVPGVIGIGLYLKKSPVPDIPHE